MKSLYLQIRNTMTLKHTCIFIVFISFWPYTYSTESQPIHAPFQWNWVYNWGIFFRLEWSELLNLHGSESTDKYHSLLEKPLISIVQISTWHRHHLSKVLACVSLFRGPQWQVVFQIPWHWLPYMWWLLMQISLTFVWHSLGFSIMSVNSVAWERRQTGWHISYCKDPPSSLSGSCSCASEASSSQRQRRWWLLASVYMEQSVTYFFANSTCRRCRFSLVVTDL